jgi:hypothetical protein
MIWKALLTLFVTASLVTLVVVAATELYVVRELLAALLVFCTIVGVIGLLGLVSFLLGEIVVRCAALLVACAAFFRSRRTVSSVNGPLAHGIGKS